MLACRTDVRPHAVDRGPRPGAGRSGSGGVPARGHGHEPALPGGRAPAPRGPHLRRHLLLDRRLLQLRLLRPASGGWPAAVREQADARATRAGALQPGMVERGRTFAPPGPEPVPRLPRPRPPGPAGLALLRRSRAAAPRSQPRTSLLGAAARGHRRRPGRPAVRAHVAADLPLRRPVHRSLPVHGGPRQPPLAPRQLAAPGVAPRLRARSLVARGARGGGARHGPRAGAALRPSVAGGHPRPVRPALPEDAVPAGPPAARRPPARGALQLLGLRRVAHLRDLFGHALRHAAGRGLPARPRARGRRRAVVDPG